MMRLLILAILFSSPCFGAEPDLAKVWNSDKVAQLFGTEYLRNQQFSEAYDAAPEDSPIRGFQGPEWEAVERSRGEIYRNKTIYGDCAVVQLLYGCPGASLLEDISCSISERGKRMIPILKYAKNHPPLKMDAEQTKCWNERIEETIDDVKKGIPSGCSE